MSSYDIITQRNIVIATIALHNYIRSKALDDPAFTIFDKNLNFVPYEELNDMEDNDEDTEVRGATQSMDILHDEIARTLWNVKN